jgi:hypothetical protein
MPPRAHEATEVNEVEEDAVEAMVPVDEGEVEAPAFAQHPRQDDLRLLGMVLYELGDARLIEELQAAAGKSARLERVDGHIAGRGGSVREQALADEERRAIVLEDGVAGFRE